MYIFEDKDDADTSGFMVSKFNAKTTTVKLGQKFWPEYRLCIEKALNYNKVNNMDFNVKQLDMAYNTHIKRKSKKKPQPGAARVKEDSFY